MHLEALSYLNLNAQIRANKTVIPIARIWANTETPGAGEKISAKSEDTACKHRKKPEILANFFFLKMDGGGENYTWWEEQGEISVSITSQVTHLPAAHLEFMPRYSSLKVFINDPDSFLLLPPKQIKQWVIYSKPDCQQLPAFNYHGVFEAWRVLSDTTQKDSLIKKLRSLHFLLQILLVLLTHNSNYDRQ